MGVVTLSFDALQSKIIRHIVGGMLKCRKGQTEKKCLNVWWFTWLIGDILTSSIISVTNKIPHNLNVLFFLSLLSDNQDALVWREFNKKNHHFFVWFPSY